MGRAGLRVTWPQGETHEIPSEKLRRNCPCASCKEERGDHSHQTPLTPRKATGLKIIDSSLQEQVSLEEIWQVGQYALGMRWGDNHQTGIYTFQYLFELGENSAPASDN